MKKIFLTTLALISLNLYAQEKPNFLIIYTDDQGYQDLGAFGAKGIKTPNIDALAKEGMVGTSFYVSASLCTPSRAALQTGKYHFNIKLYDKQNDRNVYLPYTTIGMPQEEITIAEVLKPVGYKTALIGKWHLGHKDEFLPPAQGYEQFYGIPFSHDLWLPEDMHFAENAKINNGESSTPDKPYATNDVAKLRDYKIPLMLNNEVIEYPVEPTSLTDILTTETIRFIDEAKAQDKPFYICLASPMPHAPAEASDKFKGTSQKGGYGDAVQEIDHHIGRIITHLKEQNLFDNTLIIYTSDNGPRMGKMGSAKPLKGGKGSFDEGGHRVPLVLCFPKLIEAGRQSDGIIANIDILPTIAELAGAEIPQNIDGVSLAKFLGNKEEPSPRTEFLYANSGYKTQALKAIRIGDFKLVKTGKGIALYDLKNDISEKHNLINKSPEKAQEMTAIFNEKLKSVKRYSQEEATAKNKAKKSKKK